MRCEGVMIILRGAGMNAWVSSRALSCLISGTRCRVGVCIVCVVCFGSVEVGFTFGIRSMSVCVLLVVDGRVVCISWNVGACWRKAWVLDL